MRIKFIVGCLLLFFATVSFLLAGVAPPLEGLAGLLIGVSFGSVASIIGAIFIGKTVLEQGE